MSTPLMFSLAAVLVCLLLSLLIVMFPDSKDDVIPVRVFMPVVLVPIILYGVNDSLQQMSLSLQPLGPIVAVEVQQGDDFLTPTLSTIETPNGFYTVQGAVNASKGALVELSQRPLGRSNICVDGSCYPQLQSPN